MDGPYSMFISFPFAVKNKYKKSLNELSFPSLFSLGNEYQKKKTNEKVLNSKKIQAFANDKMKLKKYQTDNHHTRYGYHQRENTGSRLFTEVKPCWTGLISGWVTISI